MTASSWVPGAAGSGFDLDNLPYGVVAPAGGRPRPAVRIGDRALDLQVAAIAGLLDVPSGTFAGETLNPLLALGRPAWSGLRLRLQDLLGDDANADRVGPLLHRLDRVRTVLPVRIGDYVDFYASIEHATNLGRLFRPGGEPLLDNWRHLPVGYHGRAGTVVVSGTPVTRPSGQRAPEEQGGRPSFGPERRLDIELELGAVVGTGSEHGTPLSIADAAEHLFGIVLLNDWSARELQRWEYQPLGPFLGKSFATSVSPWVVTLDALEPRRTHGPSQEPRAHDYLTDERPWALDIDLEVELIPAGGHGEVVSQTNARDLYWTIAQQLAHLTANGASVAPGDLLGTGTISGDQPGTYGSLIELTWGGTQPLSVGGVQRKFLEDGDEIVLRGRAGSLSLGECRGRILPTRGLAQQSVE